MIKSHYTFLPAIFVLILLISSCAEKPATDLDRLKIRRDSLKEVRSQIEAQIAAVEVEIEKRDTTLKGKLITITQPGNEDFKHYFEVYGNVQSDKAATIFGESQGTVTKIHVKEGDQVSKGQTLISLDNDLVQRNIDEVQTSLALATTLFEKQKKLWEQNIGSEVQYLEAKNRKEGLENSLATLREQGGKSSIKAPFSGVVDKIFPKLGEMAGMQSPVARIVNLENLYITADVSERYINQIAKGDSVGVVINRRDTMSSTIARIGSFINPTNRTFEIQVDLKSAPQSLLPNSLVSLTINDETDSSAVVIPSSLVMQDGEGRNFVYVIGKDSNEFVVAKKKMLDMGLSYEGRTVVKSGLSFSDEVIDKGSRNVQDGDRVERTTI